MNQDYTTENLYHFVGSGHPLDHDKNFGILKDILRSKYISHPPHNHGSSEIKYQINMESSLLDEKLILPNIICFCDIPFNSLDVHIKKYGFFGVAVSKVFLAARGARPVMYMPYIKDSIGTPHGTELIKDIDSIYKKLYELSGYENARNVTRSLGDVPGDVALHVIKSCMEKDFMAFIKPYDVTLQNTNESSFYMEREWRLLNNIEFNYNSNVLSHIVVKRGYKSLLLKSIRYFF